jgi:predicted DNA-binding WGR domain protein
MIELRRIDPAQNMRRFYRLDVQRDLFGAWCLIREWGRIGRAWQVRVVPYATAPKAHEALSGTRRRRSSGDTVRPHDRGQRRPPIAAGLGRESLFKALSEGAHPRYETINAVLHALGVQFAVVSNHPGPLQGHSTEPTSPSLANEMSAKLGVVAAISSKISPAWRGRSRLEPLKRRL